jgi:hypothetical protein
MANSSENSWKKWLSFSRLVPLSTIIASLLANVLAAIGILQATPIEQIILALLALLAADALTERVSILEKIHNSLQMAQSVKYLRGRSELPDVQSQASDASEICIVAISAISLSIRHLGFFEEKIQGGCKVKMILLNPNSSALPVWNLQYKVTSTDSDIQATLGALKELAGRKNARGSLEIRLLDVFLPFSMMATDLNKQYGTMIIEYHTYKTAIGDRPHIFLTPQNEPHWFKFYKQQYEKAWSEAKTWEP